ncbi:hypothetical protein CsSME_00040308 [Camellia sinensis var. sinensis]
MIGPLPMPHETKETLKADKVVEVKLLLWDDIQDKVPISPSPKIIKVGEEGKTFYYL